MKTALFVTLAFLFPQSSAFAKNKARESAAEFCAKRLAEEGRGDMNDPAHRAALSDCVEGIEALRSVEWRQELLRKSRIPSASPGRTEPNCPVHNRAMENLLRYEREKKELALRAYCNEHPDELYCG